MPFWPAGFWPLSFWPVGFWPGSTAPPVPTAGVIDPDADWVYFLTVRVGVAPYVPSTDAPGSYVAGVWAYYTGPTTSEEPGGDSDAEIVTTRRTWHLRVSTLAGARITRRARIREADGTVWVIDKYQLQTFGTRYRCECYKVA